MSKLYNVTKGFNSTKTSKVSQILFVLSLQSNLIGIFMCEWYISASKFTIASEKFTNVRHDRRGQKFKR